MIEVKLIADSINTRTQDRLTTFLLTYPRYIHAELMTHRMFSRNSASSRAIPVKKFRDDVVNNPVIPTHWGANQKGMQAGEELDDTKQEWLNVIPTGPNLTAREKARQLWIKARDQMLSLHTELEDVGLHKQIANRILEPWFHIQVLVSATEWENFFALRCHKDAHPDIQALADQILFAYVENIPEKKDIGEWHLPFSGSEELTGRSLKEIVKICVARAARTSYKTFEGKIDLQADLDLHDRLLASGHMSPFEHVAEAQRPEWSGSSFSGNFKGWLQYRKMLPLENKTVPIVRLYRERKALLEPHE